MCDAVMSTVGYNLSADQEGINCYRACVMV